MTQSPIFLAIIGCLLWGTSPLFAKLITLPAGFIILMRCIISTLFLTFFLSMTKTSFKIHSKKDIYLLCLIALLMNAHLVFIYEAIQLSFVAPTLIAFYSYPLFSMLFEKKFNNRPFKILDLLASALILIGLFIISYQALQEIQLNSSLCIGMFFGIASGICFAARNVCFKNLEGNYNTFWLMLIQYAVGIILLTPIYADFSLKISPQNWVYLILVSLIVGILGHSAIIKAMNSLSATKVSIISASQLIVGPILAYIILIEKLNPSWFFGGSLVFIAFMIPLFQKHP